MTTTELMSEIDLLTHKHRIKDNLYGVPCPSIGFVFGWPSSQNVGSNPGCDHGACVLEQDTLP